MNGLSTFAVRWRFVLLLVLPLLAFLAAKGAERLGFSGDYRVYFSESNPELSAFEEMQKTYDKSDNLLLVLAPTRGELFDQDNLDVLEWVTNRAWQTPYSLRVDSVTNFQYTSARGDSIEVRDLVKDAKSMDAAAVEKVRQVALNEPLLLNRLISKNARVAGVNVTYQLLGKSPFENSEVVAFARQLEQEIAERFPGKVKVYLTGMAMYNNAFMEAAIQDEMTLTPIMYLIIVAVGLLMLRSVWATGIAVLVVYLASGAALGLAGWLGLSLSSLTSSAPLIILTVCVADSVHVLSDILRRLRLGEEKRQAVKEAVRESARPIVLTSIMNSIGFLSLNASEVPPFRDLGNIVTLGIVCAMILSLLLLPALALMLPLRSKQKKDVVAFWMGRLGTWVLGRANRVLWVGIPLALLLSAGIWNNSFNDQYIKWFSPQMAFRQANDFTLSNLTGLYTIEYSLRAQDVEGVASPRFLSEVAAYTDWLRLQPEVVHVSSISDTFKRINRSLNGDEQSAYRLPEDSNVAAQSLLLYEMSLPYGLDLNNQINVDKTATRAVVTLRDLTTSGMLAFEQRSLAWLEEHASAVDAKAASTTLMFAHIGERSIHGILLAMLTAAVLTSFFLMFAFRSWRLGLLSLIPNILPIAMAFGLWGIFVSQLGFSVAIVASISLGIVVDDTVHFLSAVLSGIRERGASVHEALLEAYQQTGSALLATTVILVSGFVVLGSSSFALNQDMGLVTVLVLVLGLLTDFVMLPVLVMKLLGKRDEKKVRSTILGFAAYSNK
jgi:predicted RND superfamily exporter protein